MFVLVMPQCLFELVDTLLALSARYNGRGTNCNFYPSLKYDQQTMAYLFDIAHNCSLPTLTSITFCLKYEGTVNCLSFPVFYKILQHAS